MHDAVRFAAGLGPRDHTSDAKRELHWLLIEQYNTYKLWIIMHYVVTGTGTAPEYIRLDHSIVSELGSHACAQPLANCTTSDIPRTRTLMDSKAFSFASLTACNNIPPSIRDISSAAAFKRNLKRVFLIVPKYINTKSI